MRKVHLVHVLPIVNTIKENNYVYPKSDTFEKYKQLLDIIYSVNPKLGYPQGDLAIWLSDDANEDVRNFIKNQLTRGIDEPAALDMPSDMTNKLRTAITDEDIANFYRRNNETKEEFSERMFGYLQHMKVSEQAKKDTQNMLNLLRKVKEDSSKNN